MVITIQLENVTQTYRVRGNPVTALDHVSLAIEAGEYCAMVGESGSGKTTLMHIMGLLATPTEGRYTLCGQDVFAMKNGGRSRLRAACIGFVVQDFFLNPRLTAVENVELPLRLAGIAKNRRRKMALEALEKVGLSGRTDHLPRELSGGQQQRVAFARATVHHPALILADEPTGNLDKRSTASILDLLRAENTRGATIFMITHDPSAAMAANRVLTMEQGRITNDRLL